MKKIILLLSLSIIFFSSNLYSQSCANHTLNMYDSFGDGWNGNNFTLSDSTGTIFFTTTLPTGNSGTDSVCVPSGCIFVNCDGGAWQAEVSWDLLDSTGNIVLSGGAPYTGNIGTCIFGCTDPNAINYNPNAHINIGFCSYGCIQSDTTESFENGQGPAWVLDPNNSVDWTNQIGGTPSFNTGPSAAFNGLYYMYTETSNFGSTNSEAIMYVDCIDPTQWTQLSLGFAYHMYGATMGALSVDVSIDNGLNWIQEWTISGDQGDQWYQNFIDLSIYTTDISVRIKAETGTSFTSDIAIDFLQFIEMPTYGCTDSLALNYDSLATFDDGSCLFTTGCTNPLALNYDSLAVVDDGSCLFTTGCTNPLADNYDSTAVIDDGSCIFSNCTQISLNMYDSFGDGWNGNDFNLTNSNGVVFYTTTLSSGSYATDTICIPHDCYSITCDGGSWQGEVSWDIIDSLGNILLSGGAPYFDSICLPIISGCTDSLADNYDSTATFNDGSCFYSNCSPLTLNMYDSFGDGWNGNDFVMTSSNGTNYITATIASGSFATTSICAPFDCYSITCDGGSWQNEVSWDIIDSSGTVILSGGAPYSDSICLPIITGCTDQNANNYDSTANIDNGLCIYGCIENDTTISFENGIGITWIQDLNDDFDWSNNSGGTPSFNTGPSSAFDGSFYMYTESSSPNYPNQEAIMYVPCVDPNQWNQLSLVFAYHMYGSAMGTLSVDISTDSGTTWIQEWSLSGDQGDQWNQTFVDLSAYTSNISVRLKVETSNSFTSDVAVDLLQFMEIPSYGCTDPLAANYDSLASFDDGSCFFGCIENDSSFSFESGLGITWLMDPNNDIDWINNSGSTPSNGTGPSSAYDGSFYMYTEASGNGNGYPNKEAIMYVECIDPTKWSSLGIAFAYHMRGGSMGTLSIDVSPDSGTTWFEEWTLSGNQGNQWYETYVDLSAYTSNISVRIQGVTGQTWRSDIAVDLVRFLEMPVFGCTDPLANNYDSTAIYDDGSCLFIGCTDPYSINFCSYCNVNDSLSCLYYSCKTTNYTENFESNDFSVVEWTNTSGLEAAVTLNSTSAIADTVSLRFEGGTANNWGTYVTENQAFANNEHVSSASLCLDLTNNTLSDTIILTFEADMFSSFITTPFSWLRIKVDGNVISDSYGNSSYNNTNLPYTFGGNTVLSYDLSLYSGGIHNITFESVNKYGSSSNNPATVNYVWVDNVNISLPLISGCTDSLALNYNAAAQVDNGSCYYYIYGCTDSTALNYNPLATSDDSSCIAIVYGCTDPLALNYFLLANIDDGSCSYCNFGCTDSLSFNYDPLATCDDGSCIPFIFGCTDSTALNFFFGANIDDGSCIFSGCTDSTASNYNPLASIDDGTCTFPVFGCTDSTAQNYDSLATVDDGSCIAGIFGCTDPLALNFFAGATVDDGSCLFIGCTDPTSCNYNPLASIDDGSCIYYFGCTDQSALNYDSAACFDDGSCQYMSSCTSPKPTGLFVYDLIDSRVKIGWDNMNDSSCMVLKYFVRYREIGTSSWNTKSAGVGNGLCNFGLNTTTKQLLNLNPSTNYEFKMKAFYCNGTSSNYSPSVQFTTESVCPDMTNLSVQTFSNNQSKAKFTWDTTGAYVFARILLRVDTAGSVWQTAGGFGVYYPTSFVNKFGLQTGESYRAQGRLFCDSNITAYRSLSWTNPIFWTQPGGVRLIGGVAIENLDVYPNPSKDVFNVNFKSDKIQDLKIRIINVLGNSVYSEDKQQFVGEYTKQINLDNFGKGVYFLEIETEEGIVNKKLILN